MSNRIELIVDIDDKGSLRVTAKEADKAAKSVDKVAKSTSRVNKARDNYLRGQKGVAGATSNSTKAFSKMNQGLGGSTGLVQSYAILASNVFAATAAFNALRRVSQVQQLGEGLQFVGNVVGRDLKGAARQITEITGAAVSMSQAMRTTAVGISAGFSGEQIEQLAVVAKGASIALGRDMADALDRLVRGTAKIEPEILDELGILVRLDTAAEKYATRLGTTADSLTQFERQQAFLNETIEQGLQKYEDIANAVDPNPYDKLAASLQNLAVSTVGSLDSAFRLSDMISYLSDNMLAMTGVVTAALVPVTRRLAPGMFDMANASAEAAEEIAVNNRELLAGVDVAGKMPKVYGDAIVKIKEGTAGTQDFARAQKSLSQSLETNQRWLKTYRDEFGTDSEQYKKKALDIENVRQRQVELNKIQAGELDLLAKKKRANALQLATQGKLRAAYRATTAATREYSTALALSTTNTGKFTKATNVAKVAMYGFVGSLKVAGAFVLRFLPYIGLLVTGLTVLYHWIKNKFFPEDEIEQQLDKARESFANFSNIAAQFEDSGATGGTRIVNAYIAWAGILDEVKSKLTGINEAVITTYAAEAKKIKEQQKQVEAKMARLAEELQKRAERSGDEAAQGFWNKFVEGSTSFIAQTRGGMGTDRALAENLAAAAQERSDLIAKGSENEINIVGAKGEAQLDVLKAARAQMEVISQISTDQGIVELVAAQDIERIDSLIKRFEGTTWTNESLIEFRVEWEKIQRNATNIRTVFQSTQDAVMKFNTELNKVRQREKGPFDKVIENAETLAEKYKDLDKLDLTDATRSTLIAQLEGDLASLNIPKTFGEGRQSLESFVRELKQARDATFELNKAYKVLASRAKAIKNITADVVGAEELRQTTQQEAIAADIAAKKAEYQQFASTLTAEELENSKKANQLRDKILALQEQQLTVQEIALRVEKENLKIAQMQANLEKEALDLMDKRLKTAQMLDNLASGRGTGLTEAQELQATIRSAEIAVQTAETEFKLTMARAEIEKAILSARLEFYVQSGAIERAQANEILQAYDKQLGIQEKIARVKLESANEDLRQARLSAFETSPTQMFDLDSAQQFMNALDSMIARIDVIKQSSEENGYVIAQQFLTAVAIGVDPMLEKLKSMGPEGEVFSQITESAFAISSVWISALNAISQAGDNTRLALTAGFEAASVSVSAINSIMEATSRKAVASVDKQIEAEKKRDGKSKASIAKLKQLEKKKEQIERKAFERNKKAQMASIIMNTAAGIAKTIGQTGFFGIPLAAIVAALGAAQLAVAASQTFDGGGASSVGATAPSKVSLGERENKVDLASARNPAGELAYMRGQRGTGTGATDFTPSGAFTGRAVGGNTGIVVGEQGPELYFPDRPGTIVPADKTNNTGVPVTFNFNVNAIDADGMEEALYKQRGNLIQMFREAANAHGEFFLEGVEVNG